MAGCCIHIAFETVFELTGRLDRPDNVFYNRCSIFKDSCLHYA